MELALAFSLGAVELFEPEFGARYLGVENLRRAFGLIEPRLVAEPGLKGAEAVLFKQILELTGQLHALLIVQAHVLQQLNIALHQGEEFEHCIGDRHHNHCGQPITKWGGDSEKMRESPLGGARRGLEQTHKF